MQKLHSATVSNYEIGRLLNRTAIDLTDDVKEVQWFDFAESEEMAERVVVAGSDGTLLSFDKNNEIKVIKSVTKMTLHLSCMAVMVFWRLILAAVFICLTMA